MTISVLVPFRGDGGQRDRLWTHCRKLFEVMPVELVIGEESGEGPFNAAQAFNNAASKAKGDIFVLYGADQIPDWDRIQWGIEQLETHEWCALYANTAGYGYSSTNAILAGSPPNDVPLGPSVPFCTAIAAIKATAWVPYDERFKGWGVEDSAWRLAVETLYGPSPQPSGTLRCLYHEAASRDHFPANSALMGQYMVAAENPETMRTYLNSVGVRCM